MFKKIFILTVFLVVNVFASLTGYEYQKKLRTGINVNWALFKKEIRFYSEKVPKDFKQKGFDTVRLRFDFYECRKNKKTGIYIIKPFFYSKTAYLKYIRKIINDSLKNHLNVVLAYGACKFKLNPSKENERELINNWKLVAETFKTLPYNVSYNLIIEPGKKLNKKINLLNDFYKKAYSTIRNIDKHRILIWGPTKRSNPRFLSKTWYPENDSYIIAEWHMYAAGPKPDYRRTIPLKTKIAYEWSIKHHIPIWVGAWMPGNYNHGDTYSINEQIKFSKYMIEYLKKYHIPFAINADQQFYNIRTKKWKKDRLPVLNIIINDY